MIGKMKSKMHAIKQLVITFYQVINQHSVNYIFKVGQGKVAWSIWVFRNPIAFKRFNVEERDKDKQPRQNFGWLLMPIKVYMISHNGTGFCWFVFIVCSTCNFFQQGWCIPILIPRASNVLDALVQVWVVLACLKPTAGHWRSLGQAICVCWVGGVCGDPG
mgnify:CR=1 FL=1